MNPSCLFCRAGRLPEAGDILYEDLDCAVLLHEDWAVLGHAMVASRRHVENLSDLGARERDDFARILAQAERALLAEAGADRAILLKLGIQTPHLHIHIYPVSASLDRQQVMDAVDGRTRVPRDEDFVRRVRARLTALTA